MINYILRPVAHRFPENNRLERIWKLAQVDFKKRYYDDYFGLFWALLNPLMRLAIYYLVFTMLLPRETENYHLYLFSGLLIWMFFVECTKKGAKTLLRKRHLIESIIFERIDLFWSMALGVILGLLFNLSAYFIMSLVSGVYFTWYVLLLPFFILQLYIISVSVSMLLATINIYLKDIIHLWDLILLAGMWTSPIFFRGERLMEHVPWLQYVNPMAPLIVNTRDVLMYGRLPDTYWWLYSIGYTVLLFIVSRWVFVKCSHKAVEKL